MHGIWMALISLLAPRRRMLIMVLALVAVCAKRERANRAMRVLTLVLGSSPRPAALEPRARA